MAAMLVVVHVLVAAVWVCDRSVSKSALLC